MATVYVHISEFDDGEVMEAAVRIIEQHVERTAEQREKFSETERSIIEISRLLARRIQSEDDEPASTAATIKDEDMLRRYVRASPLFSHPEGRTDE